ncbi:MAG TPA: SRPBCC domain-containing protein [Acidimicrobiia bacterium]|nr:SRPBCC domain-containing protein [Acidimicrobiia bacterium]
MGTDGPGEPGEPGTVSRTAVLAAPVEAVWAALTQAERLSAWLGGDVDIEPFAGGQVAVREDGRVRRGVVVDVEPLRHLEIRWLPGSRRVGFLWGPDDAPAGTGGAVEFSLEPLLETLTMLRVVERAPQPASALAAA